MDLPSTDNIGSEESWQFREQLIAARTEAQTYQEELVSARKTVTALQSQLQTAKLKAKIDKLRAMEQVRQQSDKERHLLRMDCEKECGRLTELSDQLQTENQGLRREIESLKERLAEAQQEAASEPGSTVSEQDGGELVSRASDPALMQHTPCQARSKL